MEDLSNTVDQIVKISKLISDYGILIVMSAIFIIVFVIIMVGMIKSSNKQIERTIQSNDEMVNNLVAQNNQLVKQLSNSNNTNNTSKINKNEELVKTYLNVGVGLKSICKNLMTKVGAFRVAVYVFHNGNKSAHGLPFFKLTCVSEWIRLRNMSTIQSQTDIPLYLFHNLIKELYVNKKVTITNKESETADNVDIILSDTENNCILYGISDRFDNLAAFILLEFDKSTNITDEANNAKIMEALEQQSDTISDIIIFTNDSNNNT